MKDQGSKRDMKKFANAGIPTDFAFVLNGYNKGYRKFSKEMLPTATSK
jgi:hypothetical protein